MNPLQKESDANISFTIWLSVALGQLILGITALLTPVVIVFWTVRWISTQKPLSIAFLSAAFVGLVYMMLAWLVLVWWPVLDRRKAWENSPTLMLQRTQSMCLIPAVCSGVFILISLVWMGKSWWPVCELPFGLQATGPVVVLSMLLICYGVTLVMGFWGGYCMTRHFLASVHKRHLCFKCNYNLRGNPNCHCPECGFDHQTLYNNIADRSLRNDFKEIFTTSKEKST